MTTESANEFIRVRDAASKGWKRSASQPPPFSIACKHEDERIATDLACGSFLREEDADFAIHAKHTTLPEEHLAALAELERVKAENVKFLKMLADTRGFLRYSDNEFYDSIRERIESEVGE